MWQLTGTQLGPLGACLGGFVCALDETMEPAGSSRAASGAVSMRARASQGTAEGTEGELGEGLGPGGSAPVPDVQQPAARASVSLCGRSVGNLEGGPSPPTHPPPPARPRRQRSRSPASPDVCTDAPAPLRLPVQQLRS